MCSKKYSLGITLYRRLNKETSDGPSTVSQKRMFPSPYVTLFTSYTYWNSPESWRKTNVFKKHVRDSGRTATVRKPLLNTQYVDPQCENLALHPGFHPGQMM